MKKILEHWKKVDEKEMDELYSVTSELMEKGVEGKLIDKLLEGSMKNEWESLNKFIFKIYEKIADKKETKLKSSKILTFHQKLLEKGSLGLMHRSMFTAKKVKKEKEKEE